MAVLPAPPAGAVPTGSTFYVNSATDTGATDCASIANTDCGIDDAITAFDADTTVNDSVRIVFSSALTTFTVGTPTTISNTTSGVTLAIDGNSPGTTSVTGAGTNRVFDVAAGTTVAISGLTIEGGRAPAGSAGPPQAVTSTLLGTTLDLGFNDGGDGGNGGGVDNAGNLTLTDDTVSGNTAGSGGAPGSVNDVFNGDGNTVDVTDGGPGSAGGDGGGIYNASTGSLSMTGDTVTGNTAGAGGDDNVGPLDVLVNGKSVLNFGPVGASGGRGGGVFNAGSMSAVNDTVDGNEAGRGGDFGPAFSVGVDAGTGTLNVISFGTGGSGGDGGGVDNLGSASLSSVTVARNSTGAGGGGSGASGTGGGIDNAGGTLDLTASIVSESTGADCAGTVTDEGSNIDDDGSCGLGVNSFSDSTGLDGSLGPLAPHGGPTETVALTGGPAVDQVPAADCPATDQRGVQRPLPCDIGAYDSQTVTVMVSGSQNFGGTPTFSATLPSDPGVTQSGPVTCTEVAGPTAISTALPVGSYTIVGSSCTGPTLTGGFTAKDVGTPDGFVVSAVLSPASVPNAAWGAPYGPVSFSMSGAVGSVTFTEGGTLPQGLSLVGGVLSGTPTAKAQIGLSFPFTVKATDSASNSVTVSYSITVTSPCGANLTPYLLTASSHTGNFTGLFCVNGAGSGSYSQYGPGNVVVATGTGMVKPSGTLTMVSASGRNLALLGQKTTTTSTFTETAPGPMKAGTFTLT